MFNCFVCLFVASSDVKRTEGKDEIVELAAMTQMEFAFAPNLDYQGGKYGVAILSRWPIKNTVHRMFENKREAEV